MDVKELKLTIGPYEIHAIPTGQFGLDGGAMFGTVPKVLWEKTNPADEQNRISMEARGLLLKSDRRKILIDVGNGTDFVPKYGEKLGNKFAEIYAVSSGGASLVSSLKKAGVEATEITDVILTHLHFDHAGGSTHAPEGVVKPTFPRAMYYVQRENLETATNPNIREKASYLAANFTPLQEANVLKLWDGPMDEPFPCVWTGLSYGHTRAHQWVKVSDGKTTLVYCGDVIPTSTHVRLPFVMGYDLDPLKLIEEKRVLLEQAARENWYLFFEHDPYCDCAQVLSKSGDFAVKDRFRLT